MKNIAISKLREQADKIEERFHMKYPVNRQLKNEQKLKIKGFQFKLSIGNGGGDSNELGEIFFTHYHRFASAFTTITIDNQNLSFIHNDIFLYRLLKLSEEGITKIIRMHRGKRQTSFYSTTSTIEYELRTSISESDLVVESMRSSGAGGQHVNKTNSKCKITYKPLSIVVSVSDNRSFHANHAAAMQLIQRKIISYYADRIQEEKNDLYLKLDKTTHGASYIRTIFFDPVSYVSDSRYNLKYSIDKYIARFDMMELISNTIKSCIEIDRN